MFRRYFGRACVIGGLALGGLALGGLALGCMTGEALAFKIDMGQIEYATPNQPSNRVDAPLPKKSRYDCARMAHEFNLEQHRAEDRCLARGEGRYCADTLHPSSAYRKAYTPINIGF